ncbi:hypothetical protein HMN09_00213700 [Mycena chlorophos]|uniref:FAD/NAD(P)-binding domain-containing protein n=1 Tax=Mycena chlorophos TaxID=658473 RepID=A0A8H6TQ17_MYCCL|nr:hypothetical protein HMN09_00213700 [Mycena chlorophos]
MPAIVIVGAGIGGVSCAIALKRQLNLDDFVIYEKASDVGGTWRDNIYPGASSDVFIHFYSLSTDLNPDWPSTHGSQAETLEYWQKLTTKYDLYRHIVFGTQVVSAIWDTTKQEYDIVVEDVATGQRSNTTAKILVSAIGILEVPRFPDIPGLDQFAGAKFHSARWDTGVDLAGKRVGVIGNGASSTQFVPIISADPSVEVTQFCRTPNWFIGPVRAPYSATTKWVFRNFPLIMWLYRIFLYIRTELFYVLIFTSKFLRDNVAKDARGYIQQTAPKDQLKNLVPKYTMGCKRVIFDTGFLDALHRPNMNLNWDGIEGITKDGIITNAGAKIPLDVLICATGFTADRYPLHVVGDKGFSVQEYYDSQGGPKAYMGMALPGFPNLFMIGGPNTTTGHTSVILTEELQINYILKFVPPILSGLVSSFTVTPHATDAYNELIHKRLSRSVFVQCVSWYRTGATREGKVSSIFPGPMALYAWWLRRIELSDFDVGGKTEAWEKKVWWEGARRMINPLHYAGKVFGWALTAVSG